MTETDDFSFADASSDSSIASTPEDASGSVAPPSAPATPPSRPSAGEVFDQIIAREKESRSSPTWESAVEDGTVDDIMTASRIRSAADRLEAQAKTNESAVLGKDVGMLTPEQQAEWTKRERAAAERSVHWRDRFKDILGRDPYINPWSGRPFERTPEQRVDDIGRVERGEAKPAQKETWRAGTEGAITGLSHIPSGIVKGIGIAIGFGGMAFTGSDADENAVYQAGRWIEMKAKSLFPGDPARQHEFGQKLAQASGSAVGFYGPAAIGKIAGLSDNALLWMTAVTGALPEGSELYEEADDAKATTGQKLIAYVVGLGLGTTEAAPIARFLRSKPSILGAALEQAREEFAQEGLQRLGENLTAKWLSGYEPGRDVMSNVGENAVLGGITGFGMGGAHALGATAMAAVRGKSGTPAPAPSDAPRREPQPATPSAQPAEPPSAAQPAYDLESFSVSGSPQVAAQPPTAEFAGSGRSSSTPAGAVEPITTQTAPSFEEMRSWLPLDESGDPDLAIFHDVAEQVTGKRFWNQLSDPEKDAVVRALATGQQPQAATAATPDSPLPTPAAQAATQPAQQGATVEPGTAEPVGAAPAGPQGTLAAAEAAGVERQTAAAVLPQLERYASSRSLGARIEGSDLVLRDRRGAEYRVPAVQAMGQLASVSGNERLLDTMLGMAGLDVAAAQPDASASPQAASQPPPLPAPADLARQAYASGQPAAQWPPEALAAGHRDGLIRVDRDGAPRRNIAPEHVPDPLQSLRRDAIAIADTALGDVIATRNGQRLVDGDPIAIRALIDQLNTHSDEVLRAQFTDVARLVRAANRAQLLARIAQGLVAKQAALDNARLSLRARELIDQSAEDALLGRPVQATLTAVAIDSAVEAAADDVLRLAKNFDGDTRQALASATRDGVGLIDKSVIDAIAGALRLGGGEAGIQAPLTDLYHQAGIDAGIVRSALRVGAVLENAELQQAVEGIEVMVPIESVQDDGSVETEDLALPGSEALAFLDRRLKGINMLLKCFA